MCDKISVRVEIDYVFATAHESQIILEEFAEGLHAQADLQLGAVWGKRVV